MFWPNNNNDFFFVVFRPVVDLNFIDHIVGNQPPDEMESVADW